MLIIHSLFLLASRALPPRSNDKFYIYDWPDICAVLHCMGRNNRPIGRVLNSTLGTYDTHQYTLFNVMYVRALKDPRRTLDPEEATTFLIPYDSHMDAMVLEDGVLRMEWAYYVDGSLGIAPKVHDLLLASPYFRRNYGKDHLLISGLSSAWTKQIFKPKSIPLYMLCQNCTKLTPGDYSFLYEGDVPPTYAKKYRGNYWYCYFLL